MCYLSITQSRHTAVDFTFPTIVNNLKWLSKTPDRVPPTMNLARTMDVGCWILTFASYVSIGLALLISIRVGQSFGIYQPDTVRIMLTPFAMMNAEPMPTWFNDLRQVLTLCVS